MCHDWIAGPETTVPLEVDAVLGMPEAVADGGDLARGLCQRPGRGRDEEHLGQPGERPTRPSMTAALLVLDEQSAYVQGPEGPLTLRTSGDLDRLVEELARRGVAIEITDPERAAATEGAIVLAYGTAGLPVRAASAAGTEPVDFFGRTLLLDAEPNSFRQQAAKGLAGFVDFRSLFLWQTNQPGVQTVAIREEVAARTELAALAADAYEGFLVLRGEGPDFVPDCLATTIRSLLDY